MNILLVDDGEHALNRLKVAVEVACEGFIDANIATFGDSKEALLYCQDKFKPDIAFLDIQMDGLNGLQLGKALKDLNPKMKLVFCTAFSDFAMEALKLHANGYIMKPVTKEEVKAELDAMELHFNTKSDKRIVIRTFGNFDVFVDGKVVDFQRSKSKEILAILVDYNGSIVRTEQIAEIIWNSEEYDLKRQKQLYTFISDLRKDLKALKADNIIIKAGKGYAIDKDLVDCDLYRLLAGDATILNQYEGKYMDGYAWAVLSDTKIANIKK